MPGGRSRNSIGWRAWYTARRAASVGIFTLAAIAGAAAVAVTSAATYTANQEAEQGQVLGQAALAADVAASAGSAVRFGGSAATPQGVVGGTLAGVDTTKVRNANAQIGINTDIWEDNQQRRPTGSRPLTAALADLKPKVMRYPGGEQSDGITFFTGQGNPNPRLNRIADNENSWPSNDPAYWQPAGSTSGSWAASRPPYGFDQFIADCKTLGAEPIVTVALDGIYKPADPGGIAPTKAQMITNAREFVRYANKTKGYGVKYWEIGNEPWLPGYLGGTNNPAQYAADFADVAAAMKQVDPTIQVGASGNTTAYFDGILNTAAASVDFLTVHPYDTAGMSYAQYQAANLNISQLNNAVASLNKQPAAVRNRIWITATETAHYATGLNDPNGINNLGTAVITAHYAGLQMQDPRLRQVVFWNTRWITNTSSPKLAYDALAPDNSLLPTGQALAFLGHLSGRMVTATSHAGNVIAYAAQVPAEGRSSVLLINRGNTAVTGTVGMPGAVSAHGTLLTGNGPSDISPSVTAQTITVTNRVSSVITVPANSLYLIDFATP